MKIIPSLSNDNKLHYDYLTMVSKDDMLIFMTEDEFFFKILNEWGDREVYSIEKSEVQMLLSFGGAILSNLDNKDGTFSLTIKLRGKDFICITTEAINAA